MKALAYARINDKAASARAWGNILHELRPEDTLEVESLTDLVDSDDFIQGLTRMRDVFSCGATIHERTTDRILRDDLSTKAYAFGKLWGAFHE